jgi:ABC-type lipoprotein export system ATPase subunit
LQRLNREQGLTILMVTHEAEMANYCSRHIVFSDGRVVEDRKQAA